MKWGMDWRGTTPFASGLSEKHPADSSHALLKPESSITPVQDNTQVKTWFTERSHLQEVCGLVWGADLGSASQTKLRAFRKSTGRELRDVPPSMARSAELASAAFGEYNDRLH